MEAQKNHPLHAKAILNKKEESWKHNNT
jgi:hypothetical protein